MLPIIIQSLDNDRYPDNQNKRAKAIYKLQPELNHYFVLLIEFSIPSDFPVRPMLENT